jgi:hypothetical protein
MGGVNERSESRVYACSQIPAETLDMVNRPPHYTGHPSGIECIDVTEHMPFCEGNAVKYLWRAGSKGDRLENLRKAAWYIARAIDLEERRRSNATASLSGAGHE